MESRLDKKLQVKTKNTIYILDKKNILSSCIIYKMKEVGSNVQPHISSLIYGYI
jgi:hypothetical protein